VEYHVANRSQDPNSKPNPNKNPTPTPTTTLIITKTAEATSRVMILSQMPRDRPPTMTDDCDGPHQSGTDGKTTHQNMIDGISDHQAGADGKCDHQSSTDGNRYLSCYSTNSCQSWPSAAMTKVSRGRIRSLSGVNNRGFNSGASDPEAVYLYIHVE
jgi:hypothetical protein